MIICCERKRKRVGKQEMENVGNNRKTRELLSFKVENKRLKEVEG